MNFSEHPGQIYVAVTLLPLVSFVVLLLLGGLRQFLRTYRSGAAGEVIYQALGGDRPPRWPAFIALAAIGGAFVLSLIGFICYASDNFGGNKLETRKQEAENKLAKLEYRLEEGQYTGEVQRINLEHEIKDQKIVVAGLNERWSGRITWASLQLPFLNDPERGTKLELGFYIDTLAASMFLMVTFVASLIHLFSIGYMSDEEGVIVEDHQVHGEDGGHLHRRGRFGRFFMYLSLFCFSMLNLILADNLFQVFLSWELVGICSYLLIGFYFERQSASNASNKAFITNRVGDAGFVIGLLIVWTFCGTFNFQDIFRQLRSPFQDAQETPLKNAGNFARGEVTEQGGKPRFAFDKNGSQTLLFPREGQVKNHQLENGLVVRRDGRDVSLLATTAPRPNQYFTMPYWLLVAAGLGIFLGCVGKSAQFPLHVWLPDAMEGPTPVSALIHAATMVAAGVYLVGRCYPMFPPETLLTIAYTGGITLFIAATIAVVMTDIKKVLAYSTVSQLGYMMLALGIGGWVAGLFHLLTHAFFKALLFLGSGSVIYGCHHEQEMTKMGGLYPKMKTTALTMLIGVFAIAGVPLFSGWYSKDAIIAQALGYVMVHKQHLLLLALPLATAGITTFYMFRMWFMTFTGAPRDEHVYEHAHESPWTMTVPLILLAACSIFVAWGPRPWDAEDSALEAYLHHSQPDSVQADFGITSEEAEEGERTDAAGQVWKLGHSYDEEKALQTERGKAHVFHSVAGGLALISVIVGLVFAVSLYYWRLLDPADAREQFAAAHTFLTRKWYFDELYSALLVRPALAVSQWCKAFDLGVIDGVLNFLGRLTVMVSRFDGLIDKYIVDGLVNVVGDTFYSLGARLRTVQTGYIRSYILFLGLAAVSVFLILLYFVTIPTTGH